MRWLMSCQHSTFHTRAAGCVDPGMRGPLNKPASLRKPENSFSRLLFSKYTSKPRALLQEFLFDDEMGFLGDCTRAGGGGGDVACCTTGPNLVPPETARVRDQCFPPHRASARGRRKTSSPTRTTAVEGRGAGGGGGGGGGGGAASECGASSSPAAVPPRPPACRRRTSRGRRTRA